MSIGLLLTSTCAMTDGAKPLIWTCDQAQVIRDGTAVNVALQHTLVIDKSARQTFWYKRDDKVLDEYQSPIFAENDIRWQSQTNISGVPCDTIHNQSFSIKGVRSG